MKSKKTETERFWEGVGAEVDTGCWPWVRSRSRGGYGQFADMVSKKTVAAHRRSWEIHHGPVPPGLWVLHRCDNRRCVRPDHLFLGTAKDNTQDKINKGRGNTPSGESHYASRLTSAQVRSIRERYRPPEKIGRGHTGTSRVLAEEFGCTVQHINAIARGKTRTNG